MNDIQQIEIIGDHPTAQQVLEGVEWAKHNFSRELMCQKVGCYRRATWSALADSAMDPHLPNVLTCDEHLVEIGLTTQPGDRDASCFTVWPVNQGPVS